VEESPLFCPRKLQVDDNWIVSVDEDSRTLNTAQNSIHPLSFWLCFSNGLDSLAVEITGLGAQ